MNPRRLLALWRERWAKPDVSTLQVPYIDGRVSQWGIRFAQKMRWSLTGILIFLVFFLGLCGAFLLPASLPLDSQIAFSVFLLSCAFFIRIQAGVLPTLMLMGLSFIVSARYLYWRVSSTIGQDFDAAFGFGFALFVAEVFFCVTILLGFIATRWPIKRAQSNLRNDSNSWPNIDVFILCAGQSTSSIETTIQAATSFDWGYRKIKIYLLDGVSRNDVQHLAETSKSSYLSTQDVDGDHLTCINAAVLDSKGEFIVVLECEKFPNRDILKSTVGWFLRDEKLGLLLSPQHFLATEATQLTLDIFHGCDLESSFAMMRRSMLLRMGDEQTQLLTTPLLMDKEMDDLGYECAFIGFPPKYNVDNSLDSVDLKQQINATTTYFRVNKPVLTSPLLAWRLRLSSLQIALDFYQPFIRILFLAAPLPFLLGDIQIIQANLALIAAYVIPHFFHWYIAKGRLENQKRLTLLIEFKDTLLALYLTILTFVSFIGASINQIKNKAFKGNEKSKPPFDWIVSVPWGILTALNFIGLILGIFNFPLEERQAWGTSCFYILWATGNLLILGAIAAVAEEIRHISHFNSNQRSRSTMLELPMGRSLMCVAENFPETVLSLKLPTSTTLMVGSAVNFSLFRGDRELAFPGVVESKGDGKLSVRIADSALEDYATFTQLVYSRGKNWPKWLPGRDADSPLPRWLYKLFDSLRTAYGAWTTKRKEKSSIIQLTSFWKKKK